MSKPRKKNLEHLSSLQFRVGFYECEIAMKLKAHGGSVRPNRSVRV